MSLRRFLFAVLILTLLPAMPSEGVPEDPGDVPAEVRDPAFLFEVIGHLYRWYLDEVDVIRATRAGNTTLWVRSLHPDLDEGDRSLYAEVFLPGVGISVKLKKADYPVPELGAVVKSDRFKIIGVQRKPLPPDLEESFVAVEMDPSRLREFLFVNRNKATYPEGELLTRMRLAVRKHMREKAESLPKGPVTVHFAPLSPVANEAYVFWEDGRLLVRFASDLDLENPKVWEYEDLAVELIDIDEQMVVSFEEVAGSNAYYTRDQIGRALFNCIILGRKVVLDPADMDRIEKTAPPESGRTRPAAVPATGSR